MLARFRRTVCTPSPRMFNHRVTVRAAASSLKITIWWLRHTGVTSPVKSTRFTLWLDNGEISSKPVQKVLRIEHGLKMKTFLFFKISLRLILYDYFAHQSRTHGRTFIYDDQTTNMKMFHPSTGGTVRGAQTWCHRSGSLFVQTLCTVAIQNDVKPLDENRFMLGHVNRGRSRP